MDPLLHKLGIDLPIVQAPMAGVSTPEMVAAVANAGGLGSIGVGATDAAGTRKMIAAVRSRTDRPFQVNVFCHRPAVANAAREAAWIDRLRPEFTRYGAMPPDRLTEDYWSFLTDDAKLAVLLAERPAIVSFHFGLPARERIEALRSAGIVLLATATSLDEGKQIAAAGIDAVVAQGYEAGGHRGTFDPTATDDRLGTATLTRLLAGKPPHSCEGARRIRLWSPMGRPRRTPRPRALRRRFDSYSSTRNGAGVVGIASRAIVKKRWQWTRAELIRRRHDVEAVPQPSPGANAVDSRTCSWPNDSHMLDPTTVYVLAVIFVATLIRSTLGFGEALVAVPLLALRLPVTIAAPLAVLVSVVVAAVIIVQDFQRIELRSAGGLIFASLPGIPLGVLLLAQGNEHVVKTILGAVIIAFSIYAIVFRSRLHLRRDHWGWLIGCGFLSGILGGAYGMNGPPLAIYGALRRWSPQHFRATLQGYFLPASLVGLVGYVALGLCTRVVMRHFLFSLPLVAVAIFLGRAINHRLKGFGFLRVVYLALITIGAILIAQAIVR